MKAIMAAYVKFGDAISQHDGKPVVDITGTEIGSQVARLPTAIPAKRARAIAKDWPSP